MYFIPIVIVAGILAWILRPGKNLSKTGKNAILLVAIPSLILAGVSIVVQLFQNSTGNTDLSDFSNVMFMVGLAVIFIAIILLAFLAYRRRPEIVRALSFGICISVVICVSELFVLGWLAEDF
jgi:uncharacterized BrkB/YihY/UPF0761 family membrane protein